MDVALWQVIALGGGVLVAGILIGLFAARFGSGPRARIRALETELRAEQARGNEYRQAVAQHFGESSAKFRDLTREYTALYEHLARGARDLCPDRPPALEHAFDAPPLQPAPPLRIGGEPPETTAQPDDGRTPSDAAGSAPGSPAPHDEPTPEPH
jgi:uncharacterized protein